MKIGFIGLGIMGSAMAENLRKETGCLQMNTKSDPHEQGEEGIEIPLDRIDPDTVRKMVEAFVTREWNELADSGYSLDEKVDQVLRQLQDKRARIVYDGKSESWNIIPCR